MSRDALRSDIERFDTDAALVEQVLSGDNAAFATLVARYEPVVASVVHGIVGRGPDAEDVGQETFVRFYKAIGQFRGDASLKTYLTRIAINLSRNALRSRRRRRERFESLDDASHSSEFGIARADHEDFDRRDLIRAGLSKLDEKYRMVIVLRIMEEFSTKETAELLDIPEGTVLSRLSRGLDQLRTALESTLSRDGTL